MQGAEMFCRIRAYLSTCRKQGMSATQAMTLVFEQKLPEFAL
jgi:transposase